MPRLPLLNPRSYRMDDLLRRPFVPNTPVGSGGGKLFMNEAQGWGFSGVADFEGTTINAPLSLSIWVEGSPIFPADSVYRPSHITGNSHEPETGLQVIEDKFITEDDVLVAVISLRNPGDFAVAIEVRVKWGIGRGEQIGSNGEPFFVSRFAPNPESRRLSLGGGGRARMTFALALARDSSYAREPGETAMRRAASWAGNTSAVIAQGEQIQQWADRSVPRFDCPDAWCLRAWYHAFHLRRKYPERESITPDKPCTLADFQAAAHAQFENGDFDAPSESPNIFLPELFLHGVLGMRREGNTLSFQPAPDLAQWNPFCIEDWHLDKQLLTVVWDAPESAIDAYDDGDKGFTVYAGDEVIHHQNDLAPCVVPLSRAPIYDDDED